jgi:hypothetical protein
MAPKSLEKKAFQRRVKLKKAVAQARACAIFRADSQRDCGTARSQPLNIEE